MTITLPGAQTVAGVASALSGGAVLYRPANTAAASLLQRLLTEKQAPVEAEDAEIRWGKAPKFDLLFSGGAVVSSGPTITVTWPDPQQQDPEDPPDEEPPPLIYEEEWRDEEDVRIENPDDSDQYVIVARIKSILFRGPDGRRHQFNLHPKE